MKELLNIIDDNDQIIGEETREKIHQTGLLHREIHVYFVTPNKELILQHRAKDKDTYPDLLDATVGGHVEIGHSYLQTAVKEVEEETGLIISPADLIFINKSRRRSEDKATGKINNVFGESYLFLFEGNLADLKVETGKAIGFESWSFDRLAKMDTNDRAKFISYVLKFSTTTLLEFINKLK